MIFTVKPSYANMNLIQNLLFSIFRSYHFDIETHIKYVKLWKSWWIIINCTSLFQNQHTSWLSTLLDDSSAKYMNAKLNKLNVERLSRRHKMLLRLKHSPISFMNTMTLFLPCLNLVDWRTPQLLWTFDPEFQFVLHVGVSRKGIIIVMIQTLYQCICYCIFVNI